MNSINIVSKLKFKFLGKTNQLTIETKSQNDKSTEERLKKIYYIAVKTRNFEIGQLIQRNNFFMIFQGVLLACMISSNDTVPFVQSTISCAGFLIAYYQTKVAAGAKYWQEHWEEEVYQAEEKLEEFYKKFSLSNNQTSKTSLDFVRLFTKKDSEVNAQVKERLERSNKDDQRKSNGIEKNISKTSKFIQKINRLLIIFNTKKLILSKPSVSKIPIKVGQGLMIIWALLIISSFGPISHGLQWLTEKQVFHGFPNHKEAAKQEIYFSQDKEKLGALYLANNEKRNDKNEIIGPSIPFEITSEQFKKLSNSNDIFINIHIDEQGNKTTTYKFIEHKEFDTK